MAQIIVTATPVNLNVSTTRSNILVTDVETNVTVNVASLSSNISVTSQPVNVTIAPSVGVSNAEIRAAISATTPITYDSVNGIIGFDPTGNNMQVSSLTSTNFIQATGGITAGGNVTGNGLVVTNNASVGGTLTVANISIGGDLNANLKDISLSYYDAGNVSGNVTLDVANGPVQRIRLTNNLTGLTFTGATAAQPITVIIQQDNVGFWTLDTTTFAANWTDWLFASNFKTLSTTANAFDYLSVTYNGSKYYASLVNFFQSQITNSELANSNVIVNGVTISLGGQGNVTTGNIAESGSNQYFTAARARDVFGVVRTYAGLSNLTYSNTTGIFNYTPVTQNDVRAQVSAASPILYDNGNGVIRLSGTANITTTGNVSGGYFIGNGSLLTGIAPTLTNAQVVSYISTVPLTVGGNLTVNGNVNATGNLNVQNVEDLYVRDRTIVLNANAASSANVQIVANRPSQTNTALQWNETTDRWTFTNDGTTYFNMAASTTDLAEGTNLYYTTARANTAIGAYQGNINTPGTVTAGVANATTVNVTDLNATNNVTVLGKLNAADGSNVQYVRAYSTELYIENTSASLPILMFGESNNRISTGDQSLRYVPATKTLFVSEGTIGTSTNNVAGNNFTINGTTNSFGNITTNATVQAGFFKGNGSQLTGIPANIAGSENITVTGNVVSLKNALANVNSVGSESGQNLALTTNTKLTVNERINGGTTLVANIDGKGYALQNQNTLTTKLPFNYTGPTANITTMFFDGIATSGSNVITGINSVEEQAGGGSNLANINLLLLNTFFRNGATGSAYPFPEGTRLVSVDAANSRITMSQAATASLDFSFFPAFELAPGLHDATTGLTMRFNSPYTNSGSGSRNTIQSMISQPTQPVYGYPVTGFTINDFDVATYGSISDYSLGDDYTNLFIGKTEIEAPKTVMNFPRGLTIGNTDLTNRAEGDSIPSYGLNMLWDGTANTTTDYAGQTPVTQLLLKQYTQNSLASTSPQNGGPRIFFTAAQGNKNQSTTETYLRTNTELGRITWWCASQFAPGLGTTAPPAYINAVANRDMTGGHNGGVGLYLSASPNNNAGRRGLFAAHQLGTTLIASSNTTTTGASQPIVFAPMATDTGGNSVLTFNNTLAATNYQWANVNYDNATAKSGSRLSITNGASTVAGRNGNITLVLDRNDNGAGFGSKEWAFKLRSGQTDLVLTEDDVIRTTFAGANITTAGNITASTFLGNVSGATATLTGNANISGDINLTGRLLGYDQVYGEFAYNAGNITPVAADTIYAFPYDTTNFSSDIIANNTSRINIVKPGRFKLITSIQVKNNNNSADHTFRFWLRKNGTDVANSATVVTPLKLQEQVISMDWMVESNGSDYWEIVYYVNSTNVTFPYYAAITSPVTAPAAPPIIVNVIPVGA